MKNEQHILDFVSFTKKYHEWFIFDNENTPLMQKLSQWASRDARFNDRGRGWHIDKGLLFIGPVGSGKTVLMEMVLREYLGPYLKSHYRYDCSVAWSFADTYSKDGYECFAGEMKGNRYYDELCLVDDKVGFPVKEMVNRFGNKIFIGEELVMRRYNLFKKSGHQTHFSTNCNTELIEKYYGKRVASRLYEMCNVFTLLGQDHRMYSNPMFYENKVTPQLPRPREVTIDEIEENKKMLEAHYQEFLKSGNVANDAALYFPLFRHYGVELCTKAEQDMMCESGIAARRSEIGIASLDPAVERERRKLRKQYEEGDIPGNEKAIVWTEVKKQIVGVFYQKMKDGNRKSIFQEVDVNVPDVLTKK